MRHQGHLSVVSCCRHVRWFDSDRCKVARMCRQSLGVVVVGLLHPDKGLGVVVVGLLHPDV